MHLGGRGSCDVHRSACVDGVTDPGVHQLQFAQSPSLSLPDCSPQWRVGFDVLTAGSRCSSHRDS